MSSIPGRSPFTVMTRRTLSHSGEVRSAIDDEHKMVMILDLFNKVMDRCGETARKTSRGLLCWLRSSRHLTCYPKPFTFVSYNSTTKKYRLLSKRCLARVFRTYHMGPIERAKIHRARLSRKQLRYLDPIWYHVYWDEMDGVANRTKRTGESCATKKGSRTSNEENTVQADYI